VVVELVKLRGVEGPRKFGEVLGKVKRQLGTASKTIDEAETRTRVMERKLRSVQQLPEDDADSLLQLPGLPLEDE